MTHQSVPVDGPNTFRYSIDEEGQPTLAIVEAVSWVTGVDRYDLQPLSSVVDIDRMTRLLQPSRQGGRRNPQRLPSVAPPITFRYAECVVTVTTDQVRIESD